MTSLQLPRSIPGLPTDISTDRNAQDQTPSAELGSVPNDLTTVELPDNAEIHRMLAEAGLSPRGKPLESSVSSALTKAHEIALIARGIHLKEELARGGQGAVLEVTHDRYPDQRCAMKILLPEHKGIGMAVQRFEREISALHLLERHPNLLYPLDVGELPGGVKYVITPYMSGGTLGHRLAKCGTSVSARAECLRAIVDVLHGIHAINEQLHAAHRDIKPQNILFDELGTPTIADFGLARSFSHDPQQVTGLELRAIAPDDPETIAMNHSASHEESLFGATPQMTKADRFRAQIETGQLTQEDVFPGSLSYVAPEIPRGQALGPQADQYSVGVILFEILTGSRPRAEAPRHVFVQRLATEPALDPATVNPHIHPSLIEVTRRLLSSEPSQRYNSSSEAANALDKALSIAPEGGIQQPPLAARVGAFLKKWSDRPPIPDESTTKTLESVVTTGDFNPSTHEKPSATPLSPLTGAHEVPRSLWNNKRGGLRENGS